MYSLIFFSFRNLLFLKNYSGNVEELSLNFTVVNNDLGESQVIRAASFHIIFLLSWNTLPSPPSNLNAATLVYPPPPRSLLLMPLRPFSIVALQVVELKPGGRDIPVTTSNRISYIHLVADYRLNKQVSPKSLFTTYLFCLVIKSGGFVYTHILLCCYFTTGLIVANLRS